MSNINVGLHLNDGPIDPCYVLYSQLIQGIPTAAVQIDALTVYFSESSQIDQLQLVLTEARVRLEVVKEALFAEGIRIAMERQQSEPGDPSAENSALKEAE